VTAAAGGDLPRTVPAPVPMPAIDNPFLQWLGVRLTVWRPDYAEMRLDAGEHHRNRIGRIQGGLICTLLDAVCGYSGLYTEPGEAALRNVTLSLTTNFLDSGEGSELVARGYVERRGRSVYFARGEVLLDATRVLATGVGTFKYLR